MYESLELIVWEDGLCFLGLSSVIKQADPTYLCRKSGDSNFSMYFRINDSHTVVTSHPKRASLFGFVYLLENVEGGKLREKKPKP